MKRALLLIDLQYDFCSPKGALYVPNAEKDVVRIAKLIERHSEEIDQIFLTLDTHQVHDISHPSFWKDEKGQTPAPYTSIFLKDLLESKWIPINSEDWVKKYLQQLEANGQYQHIIWPPHCLAGTLGASLDLTISEAIIQWSLKTGKNYEAIIKGTNPLTEHFGAFMAQIPIEQSPETTLNTQLLGQLNEYDEIWLAGEAKSHCVATSIDQMISFAPELIPKTVLITDAMSDVTGLGHLADPIYKNARTLGITESLSANL